MISWDAPRGEGAPVLRGGAVGSEKKRPVGGLMGKRDTLHAGYGQKVYRRGHALLGR